MSSFQEWTQGVKPAIFKDDEDDEVPSRIGLGSAMARKTAKVAKKKSTPKKTSRPRKSPPDVVSLVLCDSAVTDASSQKVTLIGIFDRVIVQDPTKPFPGSFCVFSKLFGGRGKWKLQLEVESPSGKVQKIGVVKEVEFGAETIVTGITNIRAQLMIEESGRHRLYQTAGGKRIGSPLPLVGMVVVNEDKDG